MKHFISLSIWTLAVIVLSVPACSALPEDATSVMQLLPQPSFAPDWKLDGPVRWFGPENVFELIDGEAEMFFPYGFKALGAVDYIHAASEGRSVAAQVYRMGSLLDAFGIYSNFRYPEADYLELGAEGFTDDYQTMFYQNRYFVRLTAYGDPQENRRDLAACARAISALLPSSKAAPAELDLLLGEAIVAHSQRYIAKSLLGYAFFPRGLEAQSMVDGKPLRVFVVTAAAPQAADEALGQYLEYLKNAGAEFKWRGEGPSKYLIGNDPLHKGFALLPCGSNLIGCTGLKDNEGAAVAILMSIAKKDQ
jgi:hypothetical protein